MSPGRAFLNTELMPETNYPTENPGNGGRLTGLKAVLAALCVALAVGLLCTPARHSGIALLDNAYIFNNAHIKQLDPGLLRWAFLEGDLKTWAPLAYVSYALDIRLWGSDPNGFHISSIVLHALNSALLALAARALLSRLFTNGGLSEKNALWASALAGLLFGVHPLHVEPALWLAQRGTLIMAFFSLTAIIAYVYYAKQTARALRALAYAACLMAYCLALLGGRTAVLLPLAFLVFDWHPLRRLGKGALLEKSPFIVIGAAVYIYAAGLAGAPWGGMMHPLLWLKPIGFYLVKTLYPAGLLPIYPAVGAVDARSMEFMLYAGAAIIATALAVALAFRWRAWLAAWGFFAIMLLPSLLRGADAVQADRHAYLPGTGLFVLAGAGLAIINAKLAGTDRREARLMVPAICLILIAGLSAQSIKQMAVWKDGETMLKHVISAEPARVPSAYWELGLIYKRQGRLEEALAMFTRAAELDPSSSDVHRELAGIYLKFGNKKDAAKQFAALAMEGDAEAYFMAGKLYYEADNFDDAIRYLTSAILISGSNYKYYLYRGRAYYLNGMFIDAANDLRASLALGADDYYARIALLLALRKSSPEEYRKFEAGFRDYVEREIRDDWVALLARHLLGDRNVPEYEVYSSALYSPYGEIINTRLVEYYYYIGEQRLHKGNVAGAREYFEMVMKTNKKEMFEFKAARMMLKYLRGKRPR